jgi:hypothetical protein
MVFAGGAFSSAGGAGASNLAAWDSRTGAWSAVGKGVGGPVRSLLADTGVVRVGGGAGVAFWDTTTGAFHTPGGGVGGEVHVLAMDGDGRLYAGGAFRQAGGESARSIARWNPGARVWSGLGGGLPGPVFAIAIGGGHVYGGGSFALDVPGAGANMARWSLSEGAWRGVAGGANRTVTAMAMGPDGSLYAAGEFSQAGGLAAGNVAAYDPGSKTWRALGKGPGGPVYALLHWGGALYAAGSFSGGVARYSAGAWKKPGGGLDGGDVLALADGPDGRLYAGGRFTLAGGVAAGHVAAWNPGQGAWTPLGAGVGGPVRALGVLRIPVYRVKLDDPSLEQGARITSKETFAPESATGQHTLYVQEGGLLGNWSPSASLALQAGAPPAAAPAVPADVTLAAPAPAPAPPVPPVPAVAPAVPEPEPPAPAETLEDAGEKPEAAPEEAGEIEIGEGGEAAVAPEEAPEPVAPVTPATPPPPPAPVPPPPRVNVVNPVLPGGIPPVKPFTAIEEPLPAASSPGEATPAALPGPDGLTPSGRPGGAPLPGAPLVSVVEATNNPRPAFEWQSGGGGSGLFHYRIGFDAAWMETRETRYTPTSALPDGRHTLYVQEADTEGRWSDPGAATVVVDSTPPHPPVVSVKTPTSEKSPEWTIQSGGDGEGVFGVQLDARDKDGWKEFTGTSFRPETPFEDGKHVLHVRERDKAGNWSGVTSREVTVDTAPPKTPRLKAVSAPMAPRPAWIWESGGGGAGIFRYQMDGQKEDGATETKEKKFSVEEYLASGEHALFVQETDEAGNWSEAAGLTVTVDASAPGKPRVSAKSPVNTRTPGWTWVSGGEGSGVFRVQLNGEAEGKWATVEAFEYTLSKPVPKDGKHTLYVQEADPAGNWSESGSGEALVDTEPPDPPRVECPETTTSPAPVWRWKSGGGGNGLFRLRLDVAENGPWTETAATEYSPEKPFETEGAHVLEVAEQDAAGNWSEAGRAETLFDKTPPAPPALEVKTQGTGARPVWTWKSGEGGAGLFRCRLDGNPEAWEETDQTAFRPETNLSPEKEHVFEVQEQDKAGNWSASAALSTVVDTKAPEPPIVTVQSPTRNRRPSWSWKTGGGGTGVFEVQLDGTDDGKWAVVEASAYTPAKPLKDEGEHALYVREKDAAGNWSDPGKAAVVLDRTPPAPPGFMKNEAVNTRQPVWRWKSGEGGEGLFRYRLGEGPWTETRETEFRPAPPFEKDGRYVLEAAERDTAGNWSETASQALTVDTEPPAAPKVVGLEVTSNGTPTWTWTPGGGGAGVFRCQLDGEDGEWKTLEETDFTPGEALDESGPHTLFVQERDIAGNWSSSGSHAVTVDTTAPGAPVVTVKSPTSDATPEWTWKSGGNGAGEFRVQLGSEEEKWTETQKTSFTPDKPAAKDGELTLFVQERDSAGNWSPSGSARALVDTKPPAPPKVEVKSPVATARPAWRWTSGGGGGGFRLKTSWGKGDWVETAATEYTPGGDLTAGKGYTVHVQERDAAGNWSASAQAGTLVDTEPPKAPKVTGKTPVATQTPTWEWTGGGGGAGIFRTRLDSADAQAMEISATSWTAPEPLEDGDHVLSVEERDIAGNWSSSGSHAVTVDTTAPGAPVVTVKSPTSDARPEWTWKSGGNGAGEFRVQLGSEKGTWTETSKTSFAPDKPASKEGELVLYVRERDLAGNWSPSGSARALVDTTPPAPPKVETKSPVTTPRPTWRWTSGGGGGGFRLKTSWGKGDWVETTATEYTPGGDLTAGKGYTLEVQEKDLAGNWSAAGSGKVLIDTEPPKPPRVAGATPVTTKTPAWEWESGGGNGAGVFRTRLDSGKAAPEETSYTRFTPSAPLADGEHTLFVEERDIAGNWSAPCSHTVTVDTVAPPAPKVTGQSPTALPRPAWTIESGGGAGVFRAQLDGDSPDGWFNPATRAYSPEKNLPDGGHTLRVQERDAAGNWSAPASFAVVVDTAPTPPPVLSAKTPVSALRPLVTWTTGGGDGLFRYQWDDAKDWTETRETKARPKTPFKGGEKHAFRVQERDSAGNWSASAEFTLLVDTTPPAPPVLKGPALASTDRPEWTWTSGGEGGTGVFRFKEEGAKDWTGTRETRHTPETPLKDGETRTLAVQEQDQAGNWSLASESKVTADLSAPAPPVVTAKTPVNTAAPSWSWSPGGGGNGEFRVKTGEEGQWETVKGARYTAKTPLADGTEHTLFVQEADAAGNWSASGSFAVTVDLQAPSAPGVTGKTPANTRTPSWSWKTGGGGCGIFRVQLDQTADGGWKETTALTHTAARKSVHGETRTLYVAERDLAGNWSSPGSYKVEIDLEPPKAPKIQADSPVNNPRPSWRWESGGGGAGIFRYKLENAPQDWTETRETGFAAPTPLPAGRHALLVAEQDASGNWSEPAKAGVEVDLDPPAPPVVSCWSLTNNPKPSWTWKSGGDGAGVFNIRLSGTEGWTETSALEWAPETALSGDAAYTLEVRERDAAGNWSAPGFAGLVLDTAPPVPPLVKVQSPARNTGPVWTIVSGGEGDGTFEAQLDTTEESGWTPVKTGRFKAPRAWENGERHVLHVRERDAAGNWSSPGSAEVLVDTEAPAAPVLAAYPSLTRESRITVSGTREPGARVLVNGLEKAPADGSEAWTAQVDLEEGENRIDVVCEDAAGNTGKSARALVRRDATPPEAPALVSSEPETGAAFRGERLNLEWTPASDAASGLAGYLFALDTAPDTEPGGTLEKTLPPVLTMEKDGVYYLHVLAKDNAGNDCKTVHLGPWTRDTAPPEPPKITTDGGNGPGRDFSTSVQELTLEGTASPDTADIVVNEAIEGVEYAQGETGWKFTGSLGPGARAYTVTALDAAGNTASSVITVSYVMGPGTYHVDISGGTDDMAFGTGAGVLAFRTVHYAVSAINEGVPGAYVLIIEPGVYSVERGEKDAALKVLRKGLVIRGAKGGGAVVSGKGAKKWKEAFILAAPEALVEGLTFRDFSAGIAAESGAKGFAARENEFRGLALGVRAADTEGTVERCRFTAPDAPAPTGAAVHATGGQVVFTGNLVNNLAMGFQATGSASRVVGNTFVNTAVAVRGNAQNPATVQGNIFYAGVTGVLAPPGLVSNNNLFFKNDMDHGGGCAKGANDQEGDPKFADPDKEDYRLKEGSPAVDMAGIAGDGLDLAGTKRPQGAAWDAGAYER